MSSKKKMPDLLRPGERLDDLLLRGMQIIQSPQELCFSIDAVLLAHFATVRAQAKAVDLGTGTGVLALLLAARGAGRVEAIERNPVTADMAARSVALNALEAVIQVHRMDMKDARAHFAAGCADLVVANPPYCPVSKGEKNRLQGVAAARHELTITLAEVVRAAAYFLRFRGRFALVHLPERLAEIFAALQANGIEPKRLRLVQPTQAKPPSLVLVEGVRGAKPGLLVERNLIVHEPDGRYAAEVAAYWGETRSH